MLPTVREKRSKWYIPYVAKGFQEDAEALVKDFVEKGSFQLKEFAEVWNNRVFGNIFYGRRSEFEIDSFAHEAFRIVLCNVLSADEQHTKTGYFFLLHNIYIYQPHSVDGTPRTLTKIRVDKSHWESICELVKFGVEFRHIDVVVVYYKLCAKHRAFFHVCIMKPVGPMAAKYASQDSHQDTVLKNDGIEQALKKIGYLKDIVEAASMTEEREGISVCRWPSCMLHDFLNNMATLLEGFHSMSDVLELDDKHVSDEYKDDIGSRRAQLKKRQFEMPVIDRMGMEMTTDGSSSEDDDDSSSLSSIDVGIDEEDVAYLERLLVPVAIHKDEQEYFTDLQGLAEKVSDFDLPKRRNGPPPKRIAKTQKDKPTDLERLLVAVNVKKRNKK